MSGGNKGFSHQMHNAGQPNAPPTQEFFQPTGPPPSYDESKMHQQATYHGQQPAYKPPPTYFATLNNQQQQQQVNLNHLGYPGPVASNYMHPQMNSSGYQYLPHQQPDVPVGQNTIVFESGARFNGRTGGSISVPPPPPGYAATPAQKAALHGQPVILKKKKNTFF